VAADLLSHCVFLLYSPLNQGLKQASEKERSAGVDGFLLYSPLNQGLKQ